MSGWMGCLFLYDIPALIWSGHCDFAVLVMDFASYSTLNDTVRLTSLDIWELDTMGVHYDCNIEAQYHGIDRPIRIAGATEWRPGQAI